MASLRPRRADDLGLKRALSDRLLPLLAASMVYLAALALAGATGAAALARHWQGGAGAVLTVQVPDPDAPTAAGSPRADAVAAVLGAEKNVTARRLGADEVAELLRPWLGEAAGQLSLALPAVFEVRVAADVDREGLRHRVAACGPDILVEQNDVWFARLARLAGSLQAAAAVALLVVALVAAAVVSVATRAGLAGRRDAIEIVHSLGATDDLVAGKFAARVTLLVFAGAMLGLVPAVATLLALASLTLPFQPGLAPRTGVAALIETVPVALWALLPALPAAAAAIGWLTAQFTVRAWLRRLP